MTPHCVIKYFSGNYISNKKALGGNISYPASVVFGVHLSARFSCSAGQELKIGEAKSPAIRLYV